MTRFFLSMIAMATLAFAANAETTMCVQSQKGEVARFDVDKVKRVYYDGNGMRENPGVTISGTVNGYTYVDLGLESGCLWATYNVGAKKVTDYGFLFAWGETEPKNTYDSDNYAWRARSTECWSKYCTNQESEGFDNQDHLLSEDDAASANWGGGWRMPTKKEQMELFLSCDWKWVKDFNGSGVAGQMGISRKNGNVIFFPSAGYFHEVFKDDINDDGYYWSSSLEGDYPQVLKLSMNFSSHSTAITKYINRYYGLSIRAVVKLW